MAVTDAKIIAATRQWLERVVIGLDLCPFASRPLLDKRVNFTVTEASDEDALLVAIQAEFERLVDNEDIETSLIIHPHVLDDFYDYNDFLERADQLLEALALEGVFQIASFHPNYQFAGTQPEAAENYSNRSPYPMLHILRERSVSFAVDGFPGIEDVPFRNIERLNQLGAQHLQGLLLGCSTGRDY